MSKKISLVLNEKLSYPVGIEVFQPTVCGVLKDEDYKQLLSNLEKVPLREGFYADILNEEVVMYHMKLKHKHDAVLRLVMGENLCFFVNGEITFLASPKVSKENAIKFKNEVQAKLKEKEALLKLEVSNHKRRANAVKLFGISIKQKAQQTRFTSALCLLLTSSVLAEMSLVDGITVAFKETKKRNPNSGEIREIQVLDPILDHGILVENQTRVTSSKDPYSVRARLSDVLSSYSLKEVIEEIRILFNPFFERSWRMFLLMIAKRIGLKGEVERIELIRLFNLIQAKVHLGDEKLKEMFDFFKRSKKLIGFEGHVPLKFGLLSDLSNLDNLKELETEIAARSVRETPELREKLAKYTSRFAALFGNNLTY